MSAPSPSAAVMPAPALREDLRLHASKGGDHLVYDPIAHRYHELDAETVAILARWRAGETLGAMAMRLSAELATELTAQDLHDIAVTLDRAGLLAEPMLGWRALFAQKQAERRGPMSWLLHNYLFIRIPLVRPNRFLGATLPMVRLLWSRPALVAIALMGLVGLYLTSRQWDGFTQTFLYFFSVEGAAGYLAALAVVKLLHEAGHAYAARHFGCRVPTMGVALLVLAPVLYTDVTDAWRLQSRRQRLIIAAAGMFTEMAIAAIALFLWALLPDGTARSACFFVATTSLVMSLAINLSPLMRFDGYYLLSDLWDISNLQPRAFALMRWALREALFGLGDPCPEDWSRGKRIAVIAYAVATCIYRLGLFVGIALLVYHLTFKTLGILLFAVEIVWFVLRPIANEVQVWWAMRARIAARRRSLAPLAGLIALLLVTVAPWPHRVEVPAVLEPVAMQRLAAPLGAKVVTVAAKNDDTVEPGDLLVQLEAPKVRSDIAATRIKIGLATLRRDRRVADRADRDATLTLEQELASLTEKLDGLTRLEDQLTIRATVKGRVADLPPDLHEGRWVSKGEEIGFVVAALGRQVRGYLSEDSANAIAAAAEGVFIPDEPLTASVAVRLASVATGGVETLDLPYLASTFGGSVAVNEDRQRRGIPVEAQYQFVALPATPLADAGPILRGVVRLDARPDSMAERLFRRAVAVLVRESGF